MSMEQRIECGSGRLLGRITAEGVKFWCDKHRREELRTWEELDALRRSLMPPAYLATTLSCTPLVSQ